jgi:hypothetical protein
MGKWLRGWFVWRFGLWRFVVAIVFLGAVLGLNIRSVGPAAELLWAEDYRMVDYFQGWPLPFTCNTTWMKEKEILHVLGVEDESQLGTHCTMDPGWYDRIP